MVLGSCVKASTSGSSRYLGYWNGISSSGVGTRAGGVGVLSNSSVSVGGLCVGEWGGRQCGRDHSMFCCWEEPAYVRCKATRYAHREREAQRGITLLSKVCAAVTNEQPPLQKVTKSLYIVTHLGQRPFILFTQMARTWALKEDSVNTTIIRWYLTLPRDGRIHG